MKSFSVKRYQPEHQPEWDAFARQSRNGTFLFQRAYMDYHQDRFLDHSLMVYDGETLIAVLPAHETTEGLRSHWGLTYGGFVYGIDMRLGMFLEVLRASLEWLEKQGIASLFLKEIPSIFHQIPSDEPEYAMFLTQAELIRCDSWSVIDRSNPLPLPSRRLAGVRKAIASDIHLIESDRFAEFWNDLLIPHMGDRFDASPVHTLEEILLLKSRFPNQIRLFLALSHDEPVAGCVMFDTETTAHMQYISARDGQLAQSAMDFLRYQLIMETYSLKRYINFGASNMNEGRNLKEGILFWKESFGARTVTQKIYKVPTASHRLLEKVLI